MQQLAEGLIAADHQVCVVGVYNNAKDSDDVINGVRVIRLKKTVGGLLSGLRDRVRISRAVRSLERAQRLDIVEAPEWAGESALLHTNARVILRLHSSHRAGRVILGLRPSFITSLYEQIALQRADHVCSVSYAVVRQTADVFPSFKRRIASQPFLVIPNGVDTQTFHPLPEVVRRNDEIVFVGSIKPLKGIGYLLQAFERINKEWPCTLAIYGSDSRTADGSSYLDSELARISEVARHNVHYKGRVARSALPAVYSSATMAIFPSLAEAFPLVCLEAMACGTPVIFSTCGPHTEIIDNGTSGLFCEARDPDNIAQKALTLFRNKALRESISSEARIKVCKQFEWNELLARNIRFYDAVVRGAGT